MVGFHGRVHGGDANGMLPGGALVVFDHDDATGCAESAPGPNGSGPPAAD